MNIDNSALVCLAVFAMVALAFVLGYLNGE